MKLTALLAPFLVLLFIAVACVGFRWEANRVAIDAATAYLAGPMSDSAVAAKQGMHPTTKSTVYRFRETDWLGAQFEVIFDSNDQGTVTVTLNAKHGFLLIIPVALRKKDFAVLDVDTTERPMRRTSTPSLCSSPKSRPAFDLK